MVPYVFSEADRSDPAYCLGCLEHIPRAVARKGGGYCPVCLASQEAVHAQLAEQAEQAAQLRKATQIETDTGFGKCPNCSSGDIVERNYSLIVNIPISLGIAWALLAFRCNLFVTGAIFTSLIGGGTLPAFNYWIYRRCARCGHWWHVDR